MRKSSKLTLLLLLLAVVVLVTVSCRDKSVDEIFVNDDGMPQLVYVLGEELDLSNGLLSVKDGDDTQEIAMNEEGVSASGYDKNKLGEQTVTISYKGQSTQITVTVVERMTVVNAVTDYLVGETLDVSKGSVKITRDDGTSYTVNLNNPKVTFEGFSSASAGAVSVAVSYDTGTEVYACSFNVNVYALDSVEFTKKPTKLSYNSHEGNTVDLTGGYLTVKGKNGSIEKTVPLTNCTISGFDISAVTEANSPYTQQVTVAYCGQSVTYDVSLVYTDISKFKDSTAPFIALDWEADTLPEVSNELGELSLELMESYLQLTKAQTNFITSKEKLAVVRAAFLYGMERLDDDLIALEDAFYMYMGELVFTCESYDAVEDAVEALADKSSDLYTVTPILAGIIEEFAEEDFDGNTFNYYGVISVEEYELLSEMLQYALDLSDKFDAIPTDWQTQGASNYADQIEDAYGFMYRSGYYDAAYVQLYYAVSSWRGGDDIFDILYTYYYNADNMDVVVELASIALPTALDELLSYVLTGVEKMYSFVTYLDVFDTTEFLRCYYMALRISEQIQAGDDEMVKALYNELPLNTLLGFTDEDDIVYYFDTIIDYLEVGEGGVQYCAVAMFGTPAYHNLLDKYMDIVIKLYEDEAYTDTAEYGTAVEDMFATYLALSPAQQYNFLSSLNPIYYGMYPELAFDAFIQEGEDYTCQFVKIIHEYYRGKFADSAAAEAYNDLVIAIEIYAQRASYEDWITEFSTRIDNVTAVYGNMSDADKAVFDSYLRSIFNDCQQLLIYHSFGNSFNPGEWQDEFDALGEALNSVVERYQLLSEGLPVYISFFSAFEKANFIANQILESGNETAINAFYHNDIFTIEYIDSEGFTTSIACSYDFAINYYRAAFASGLVAFPYGEDQSINIYAAYNELQMSEFMREFYDVIWCHFNRDYDRTATLAVIEAFRQLTIDQQILFIIMDSEGFYYTALNEFAKTAFTENAAAVATKLFELEQYYILYMYYPVAESLESVETALTELKAAYAALEDANKTSFADLEELYSYYVDLCEDKIAEVQLEETV